MKKKQAGITLISLVITIVILLILAGISISALTNTGLFGKAKEAKQKTENAQAEENAILDEYEDTINGYLTGETSGENSLTNIDTSKTNPQAAMPNAATIVEGDATKGIVIKDSNNNEWVWVEIPKTIFTTATSASDYDNIKADLITYATDYRQGSASQSLSWTDEYYEGCGVVTTETKTAEEVYTEMYNKMLASVYTNGGFWISRYEIGDVTSTESNTTRTEESGITGTAVSQANQIPYNYVTCSQAQTLASGMSTDSSKTSSLLFGIQWDLTCKFIEEKTDLELADINSDSTSWGNYYNSTITNMKTGARQLISSVWTVTTDDKAASSSILLTTGASEQTNKMNIYDFAGNEWEWTLEHATSGTSSPCVRRGGIYVIYGSNYPASIRSDDVTSSNSDGIGFRSALY